MKATDLMLDDWVLFRGRPHKIKGILSGVISLEAQSGIDAFLSDFDAFLEDLEPIPLTAEILEKNGFHYKKLVGIGGDTEIWRIEDDYYDIDMYEWSDSIWVFRYDCCEMSLPHTQVVMSYVHELQRALRDCGIEKEIVL